MAQQGKQKRAGAPEGFAQHSVNLFYWLTVTSMRLISTRFFLGDKSLYPFKALPCPINSDLFLTHILICSLCMEQADSVENAKYNEYII
jgi:hypothetical protein